MGSSPGAPQLGLQLPRVRQDGDQRHLGLPPVPPARQGALGISVDQHHWAKAALFRRDGQMPGQGRLAGSALLAGERDHIHPPFYLST
jgi:hypothetical protein